MKLQQLIIIESPGPSVLTLEAVRNSRRNIGSKARQTRVTLHWAVWVSYLSLTEPQFLTARRGKEHLLFIFLGPTRDITNFSQLKISYGYFLSILDRFSLSRVLFFPRILEAAGKATCPQSSKWGALRPHASCRCPGSVGPSAAYWPMLLRAMGLVCYYPCSWGLRILCSPQHNLRFPSHWSGLLTHPHHTSGSGNAKCFPCTTLFKTSIPSHLSSTHWISSHPPHLCFFRAFSFFIIQNKINVLIYCVVLPLPPSHTHPIM